MKKIIFLLIALISLSACTTQKNIESNKEITNNPIFQDINEFKWTCSHGAYQREIEIKGDYLIEHSFEDQKLSTAYKLKHSKDNIFEIKQLDDKELKQLQKLNLLGTLKDNPIKYTHLKVRNNKDIDLAIINDEYPLEEFIKVDIGHPCELLENIQ